MKNCANVLLYSPVAGPLPMAECALKGDMALKTELAKEATQALKTHCAATTECHFYHRDLCEACSRFVAK